MKPSVVLAVSAFAFVALASWLARGNDTAQATGSSIFGDGSDGSRTVAGGQTFDDVRTPLTNSAAWGQPDVQVVSTTGLAAGQEVIIIQMQGTGSGLYEFATIQSVNAGSITLTANLANAYTVGGTAVAQLLRVWHYQNLTVQSGGVVTAHSWDGNSGGIIAFRVRGTLTIASGGSISANGLGYRGAPTNSTGYGGSQAEGQAGVGTQSTNANGVGGGGGCSLGYASPPGGGGGGYGTAGTAGNPGTNSNCNTPGAGGSTLGSGELSSTIFFGGGGGSGGSKIAAQGGATGGYGGSGGGIVLAFARSAVLDGAISADGDAGGLGGTLDNKGGNGGGGAGGSIRLVVANATASAALTATPGAGGMWDPSASENGGPGGIGRIEVQYCQSYTGSSDPSAVVQQISCPADVDTDGDGCIDKFEQQTAVGTEVSGGQRDYQNGNDYFNPSHDHVNRVDDILLVVQAYFKDDNDGNSGLPPYAVGYNPDFDRTLVGPLAWNLGPPNGLQRVDDILNQLKQYFHDC